MAKPRLEMSICTYAPHECALGCFAGHVILVGENYIENPAISQKYMYNKSQSTKVMCILLHLINNKNHWTSIPDNGTHHVSSPFFARHVLLHLLSSPLGIFEDLRCRRFTPPPVEMVVYTSTSLVLWLLGCWKTRKNGWNKWLRWLANDVPPIVFGNFKHPSCETKTPLVVCRIMCIM